MQSFNFKAFFCGLFLIVICQSISTICYAMDKENVPNNIPLPSINLEPLVLDKKISPQEKLTNFFGEMVKIPIEQLDKNFEKYGCSLKKIPNDVLNIMLSKVNEAEEIAEQVINEGLQEHEVIALLQTVIKTKNRDKQKIDPLSVFVMLKALEDRFHQDKPTTNETEKAFKLMARAVLNAPFTLNVANRKKKNNDGSSPYFFLMAEYQTDLLVKKVNDDTLTVLDNWQTYFNQTAYILHTAPWLSALYFFYHKEAQWLNALKDPFADINFMKTLRKKISHKGLFREDHFYLERLSKFEEIWNPREQELFHLKDNIRRKLTLLVNHANQLPALPNNLVTLKDTFIEELQTCKKELIRKESRFIGWLDEDYLITDVDIYWHLLPMLAGKEIELQEEFWTMMIEAGANPLTLIDRFGQTPLRLAKQYHLEIIKSKISKPISPNTSKATSDKEHNKKRPIKGVKENEIKKRSKLTDLKKDPIPEKTIGDNNPLAEPNKNPFLFRPTSLYTNRFDIL